MPSNISYTAGTYVCNDVTDTVV
ncbi:hypothetical protein JYG23_02635 [Sedimentibacter sp. zth1]|nr:hypothetical protein JYG23_02635 [Sedimentibacter sp. zth1]